VLQNRKYKLLIKYILLLLVLFILFCTNPWENYQRWKYGVQEGVKLEGRPVENMLSHELENVIEKLAIKLEVSPRNAFIDRISGEVVPEVTGRKTHHSITLAKVMEAKRDTNVSLKIIEIQPEITAKLLNSINQPLGSYQTYIAGGGNGRVNNIIVATHSINNVLIAPGEMFSFNQTTGPRTMDRGYQFAPIMVGNQIVPGLGGGICQVSSTLYNAVLEAGLEVIERRPHSMPVNYVPRGKDATVSDHIDFKFRNNTNKYLLLKTSTQDYRVNVTILSNYN